MAGKIRIPNWLVIVMFIGAQWALSLTPFALLLPALLISALVWAQTTRRLRRFVWILLGGPLFPPFILGLLAWSNPRAPLQFMGYPSGTTSAIDAYTRHPRSALGCIVTGNEWVFQSPFNWGIRLMTALKGRTPGTYDGPMLTRSEALAALQYADQIDAEALRSGTFKIHAQPVRIPAWLGDRLLT